jgi:hypothetical protein
LPFNPSVRNPVIVPGNDNSILTKFVLSVKLNLTIVKIDKPGQNKRH